MKTNTDIGKRWEEGVDHHPKAVSLYKLIEAVDFKLCDDSFGFKSGGDGDNGETLMYLLDVIFDAKDNNELDELKKLVGLNG